MSTGGDPTTDSDTLIVMATSGADTIGYNPSSTLGAGSVTVNAAPAVNFTTTESVSDRRQWRHGMR